MKLPMLIPIETVEQGDKIRVVTVVDGVQIIRTGIIAHISESGMGVKSLVTIEGGMLAIWGTEIKKPTTYLLYRKPVEDTPLLDIEEWIKEHG